jgi:hypothetical protein
MGLVAAVVNITIYENGTFNEDYIWESGDPPEAVDLTGFSAKFTVRAEPTGAVLISGTDETGPWAPDADTGIYFDEEEQGGFKLYINDADSSAICADHEDIEGVYDIFLYSADGEAVFKQYGKATLKFAVTANA